MSTSYVVTLLAKDWNQQRALSFLTSAQSQGLSLQAGEAGPLDGASLWMQRVWAGSQTGLMDKSLEYWREAAEIAGRDVFVESEPLFRTPRRLFVFDMDSTLIQAEIVDELAGLAGVKDRVAAITERAMRGEINFRGALGERLRLLKGLPE